MVEFTSLPMKRKKQTGFSTGLWMGLLSFYPDIVGKILDCYCRVRKNAIMSWIWSVVMAGLPPLGGIAIPVVFRGSSIVRPAITYANSSSSDLS
jgi:hypothetical protein